MQIRRTKTATRPDNVDKAIEVMQKAVVPKAKELPGFVGGYWLGDRSTGEAVSVLFYDTPENLRASTERAAQLRTGATQQIGAEVKGVHEFEVVLDTGKKVHTGATHARYVEFEPGPGKGKEIVNNIEQTVLPAARELPGFLGGFWAADLDKGEGFGVTLFDSHEHLVASREKAKELGRLSQQKVGGPPPKIAEYEVLARAETPVAAGARA